MLVRSDTASLSEVSRAIRRCYQRLTMEMLRSVPGKCYLGTKSSCPTRRCAKSGEKRRLGGEGSSRLSVRTPQGANTSRIDVGSPTLLSTARGGSLGERGSRSAIGTFTSGSHPFQAATYATPRRAGGRERESERVRTHTRATVLSLARSLALSPFSRKLQSFKRAGTSRVLSSFSLVYSSAARFGLVGRVEGGT